MNRCLSFIIVILLLLVGSPAGAEEPPLRISTSYHGLLSNPSQTGMLDQVVIEASRRIGRKAEIVFVTTKRSLVAVNDGQFDGELNRIKGMEKSFPNLVRVPEPNMQMQFVAFAKRDIPISDWESLRQLKVGFVSGWKILERNTKDFPNLTRVVDVDNLFRMLHLDRLDVVLYSKLTGYEHLNNLGFEDINALSPPLAVKDMFLYLHSSNKDLILPLARAMRAMKRDGTYDHIVEEAVANHR